MAIEPIWWEKTVEYLYVAREMTRYSFVAPLAGKQEAAADVILRDLNARWNLVEFKRIKADIKSELLKYDHASESFRKLAEFLGIGKKNVPHFIVYGCCDELGWVSWTYWRSTIGEVGRASNPLRIDLWPLSQYPKTAGHMTNS